MIKQINLKFSNFKPDVTIIIDGRSILGNPFRVLDETNKNERNKACYLYHEYFYDILHRVKFNINPSKKDLDFVNSLYYIYKKSKSNDIELACWYTPEKCHTDTIKDFLENKADEYFFNYGVSK